MIERIKSYAKIFVIIFVLMTIVIAFSPLVLFAFILKPKEVYMLFKSIPARFKAIKEQHKADEPTPTDDTNYHAKVFEALATPIKKNK